MKYILKSTLRNFIRKPATNLINLLGLAVSLALVIILSVYCYSELTTDNFHKNGDRVYLYGDLAKGIYTPAPLKANIDLSIPGVESTVRVANNWEAPVFQEEGKDPVTSDLIFADEGFFKLFTYKAIEGNLESALKEPMSVVISKSLAKKLFGGEPAVGKILKLNNDNDKELTVTAVLEEINANSCLSFSAVASTSTKKIVAANGDEFTNWDYGNFQTFLLLKKGVNPEEITKSIVNLIPENKKQFFAGQLIPLKKLYFSKFSIFGSNYLQYGDKGKVMILLMVAALVLLIALVNFVNISSSQWLEKIRQTGVMKVIGARRSVILQNVLVEAGLFFMMALSLSLILIRILSPVIQGYTGIHFNSKLIYSPGFMFVSVAGTLALSLVFSLVPALRISSSRAVDNLKKTIQPSKKSFSFSGILVTAQFMIAIVLIAFTVLVQKQVNFGSNNLGFNPENIVGIKLTQQLKDKRGVFKQILKEKPAIRNISFTQYYPGSTVMNWVAESDQNGEKKKLKFDVINADAGIFEIMGLKLTTGRFFSEGLSSDAEKLVVNETFVREHKLANPVGFKFLGCAGNTEIIGVVKDFHYKLVSQPIAPLAIRNNTWASYCLINLQTADFKSLHATIQSIRDEASNLSPSFPVEVSFFDQAVERMYQSELQFRRTFSLFAGSAIVICCMGILAMSLFACQRRIKEIGIRKVNGATISEVMTMLNRDFVKWVAIAFLIATPMAWYAMTKWLENFAYKTALSWWIFALAGGLALGIALLTVGWQTYKAARRNPVESLRCE